VEYIPIGDLHIDDSYQRDIDDAFVNKMARNFDYSQLDLQAWSIGRRMGAGERHTDWIIDGQHRWLALRSAGIRMDWPDPPATPLYRNQYLPWRPAGRDAGDHDPDQPSAYEQAEERVLHSSTRW
jgi:hypothetical protein